MNNPTISTIKYVCVAIGIICLAATFRITGVNWDEGQHLHPDERFLTMVVQSINWPSTFREYLSTDTSPLNPQNTGHAFYVYGTWPIILVKWIAGILHMDTYSGITIVGRVVAAVTDIVTLSLVMATAYVLADRERKHKASLIAGFAYATMALPIQLSHFFAVDPFLTMSAILLLFFLSLGWIGIPAGIAFGMAFSAKISAILLIPIIVATYGLALWKRPSSWFRLLVLGVSFSSATLITIRLLYPYLFIGNGLVPLAINPHVMQSFQSLESLNDPNGYFPPGIQWITTHAYLYPLMQLTFFGIGLPHLICFIISLTPLFYGRTRKVSYLIPMVGIIGVIGYQGAQYVKALRYFALVYPYIAVIMGLGFASWTLWGNIHGDTRVRNIRFGLLGTLASLLLWPTMVTSIYRTPHTRVTASMWIEANVPNGSIVTSESWDDGLPLPLPDTSMPLLQTLELGVTGPDTEEKMQTFEENVARADYIFITSNRGYGSMGTVPDRFPKMTAYYTRLFAGNSQFEKVASFTSRPTLPLPFVRLCITPPWFSYGKLAQAPCDTTGISVVDDYADETWTVYDHPVVTIFKRK